ncbi:MAG: response regulator transcription factor [Gammaproteobacteria bacterium]|nr:response regulator transcription factor [Gammaproteobacteria bacterium]MBU2478823.1 response regulator transcription factor [Gammaproteobacteria bacterium]
MASPLLLWINMTVGKPALSLCERLEGQCRIEACDNPAGLAAMILSLMPMILCFDFDHPNQTQLNLLQKTKLQFPSIPILMFTASHSAELMVWALRTRVWDCFIKPVSAGEVIRRLNIMLPILTLECGQRARPVLMPQRTPLARGYNDNTTFPICRTQPAQRHLLKNYHEKTSLADMAELCAMDSFEFSRAFKREQGCTFREFLQRARIEAAADQLRSSRQSVIDIAGAVGFNDPSHFTRQFRQYMGVTPSSYRNTTGTEFHPQNG